MLKDEERQLNRFDYDTFDLDTRRLLRERAEQIRGLARKTASSIVEIGKYLTEVKEQLGHGQFLKWIDAELRCSERAAENFMAVYARLKSANFAYLQIDVSAPYLIAAPSTPESVRVEAVRRAENGEHVSHREVRALVQSVKKTEEPAEVAVPGTLAEQRPQTHRPPNNRQQKGDRAALDRVLKLVSHLQEFAYGLKDLNLEAAARADRARSDGIDLALAIPSIEEYWNLIEEWEMELSRLFDTGGPLEGSVHRAVARMEERDASPPTNTGSTIT